MEVKCPGQGYGPCCACSSTDISPRVSSRIHFARLSSHLRGYDDRWIERIVESGRTHSSRAPRDDMDKKAMEFV